MHLRHQIRPLFQWKSIPQKQYSCSNGAWSCCLLLMACTKRSVCGSLSNHARQRCVGVIFCHTPKLLTSIVKKYWQSFKPFVTSLTHQPWTHSGFQPPERRCGCKKVWGKINNKKHFHGKQQASLQQILTSQQEVRLCQSVSHTPRNSRRCGMSTGGAGGNWWNFRLATAQKWEGKCRAEDEDWGPLPPVSSLMSITMPPEAEKEEGFSKAAKHHGQAGMITFSVHRGPTTAGNRQPDERDIRH